MSTLRGAVIGAGYFSQFHYDAWARLDGVEIVALCDVDEGRSKQAAESRARCSWQPRTRVCQNASS